MVGKDILDDKVIGIDRRVFGQVVADGDVRQSSKNIVWPLACYW